VNQDNFSLGELHPVDIRSVPGEGGPGGIRIATDIAAVNKRIPEPLRRERLHAGVSEAYVTLLLVNAVSPAVVRNGGKNAGARSEGSESGAGSAVGSRAAPPYGGRSGRARALAML